MTLISEIIKDAFRECNILPLNKEPTEPQAAEALRLLNASILSIYGEDAGEDLEDWPLGDFGRTSDRWWNFDESCVNHPPLNHRLIAVNQQARTVQLSGIPQDGARMSIIDPYGRLSQAPVTLDANGRTIEGQASVTLDTDGTFTEWFYRADKGGWYRITQLSAEEEMPFPAEFDNFFIILLAIRLNPRYGRELDPQSQLIFGQERRRFINRYLQSQPLHRPRDISWPFMPIQSYGWQGGGWSSNAAWNHGDIIW